MPEGGLASPVTAPAPAARRWVRFGREHVDKRLHSLGREGARSLRDANEQAEGGEFPLLTLDGDRQQASFRRIAHLSSSLRRTRAAMPNAPARASPRTSAHCGDSTGEPLPDAARSAALSTTAPNETTASTNAAARRETVSGGWAESR